MSEVFVSYKRDNIAVVSRLVEALRAEGLRVWWDLDIPPNAAWEQTIERQLSAAKVVIVAWSPAAVASDNVKAEARWARQNRRLLQVFVEACDPPLFFGERQGVDLKSWSGAALDPSFRTLLSAIREELADPGANSNGVTESPLAVHEPAKLSARRSDAPVAGRSRATETAALLPEGAVLNGLFEVRRLLGRGVIGEVYEGASITTRERVAIKVFHPKFAERPEVQEAFLKYMRGLTRLSHPAINTYRLAARDPTYHVLYLVYEFVDGLPLNALVGQVTVTEAKLLSLARRLAEGLKHAHDLGVVHRQLSPENIIVPNGRLDAGTIIDFGISDEFDSAVTSLMAGEKRDQLYAAPEQFGEFGGEVGPWTDVYSLGSIILALGVGVAPDGARRGQPDLSHMPRRLKPLIAEMLAVDPESRLQSMDAVLNALDGKSRRPGGRSTRTAGRRSVDGAPGG